MIPRLRQIRIEKRVTMFDLSKRTGFGVVDICRVERGKEAGSPEFFQKCGEVLGVSATELAAKDETERD